MPSRMRRAAEPPRDRRGATRQRVLGWIVGLLAVAGVGGVAWLATQDPRATPPVPHGAPIRVDANGVDGVYLLTSRHRTYTLSRGRNSGPPTTWTDLEVDLWRFDPATARPVWARRVWTEEDGDPRELALLGADGDVLWLHVRGPHAVSTDSGALLADPERLAALNPALGGTLPTGPRQYAFGADGLRVTADDGRVFRLDGPTLVAQPVAPAAVAVGAAGTVTAPAFLTPAATHAFQRRGLAWPGHWLGVLDEQEGEAFRRASAEAAGGGTGRGALAEHRAAVHAPPALDGAAMRRYRLWTARVTPASRAPADWPAGMPDRWGTRDVYGDIGPLAESPEFLQGGLLAAGGAPAAPITVRGPDGVLVLHRDRLGEAGLLRLTRAAAPAGRTVWEAALPLSELQAVLPGERFLVLYGLAYTPSTGSPRDPHHDAHVVLASVELATGAVRAWDVTAEVPVAEAPEAAP